jgi:hypothetical protein
MVIDAVMPSGHRTELARRGLLLQRVEVLTGQLHEFSRAIDRDPSLDVDPSHVLVGRHEIELLRRLCLHYLERIAGGLGFVDDEHSGGALPRANLVLVSPAAVVGHRLAAECLRVVRDGRIVDEHHQRLSFNVNVLVVVPLVFRSDDAVADKHQVRSINARGVGHVFRPGNDVVLPFQRQPFTPLVERQRRWRRRNADERHLLNVGTIGVAWLESGLLKLIDEITNGQILTLGPGPRPSYSSDDRHRVCAMIALGRPTAAATAAPASAGLA